MEVAAGERVAIVGALVGEGRVALEVVLLGAGASVEVDMLYAIAGREHAIVELKIDHRASGCRSRSLVKGLAAGEAVGEFTGHVHVAPDAQQTDAQQQSRNILLGEGARIFTRPQLEIYADDVRCSHGATLGQLDPEALLYMRQRGLSLAEARRLQLEGFIADITSRLDPAVGRLIDTKLGHV